MSSMSSTSSIHPALDAPAPIHPEARPEVRRFASAAEFLDFIHQPENVEHDWEWIGGEVYRVVSSSHSSTVAANILLLIGVYIKQHKLGRVTGADGGYIVNGQRFIPDVAFVRKERDTREEERGYLTYPPDLAVEVVSPTDDPRKIMKKLSHYLQAGCTLWVVYPEAREVDVYSPQGGYQATFGPGQTLLGNGALEGLAIVVDELFVD
jgi:Uma2 family endonuclease